jgi:hypothetical protein
MADAGYGYHAAFRAGPTERGSPDVRQVKGDLTALSGDAVPELWPYAGRTPRTAALPHPAGRAAPACAGRRSRCHRRAHLAGRHPPAHWPPTRSRPTGWLAADGSLPTAWLLAQWPPQAAEPTDYSLADLLETTPLPELVRQDEIRRRIQHD